MQSLIDDELYKELMSVDSSKIRAEIDIIGHLAYIEIRIYEPDIMKMTEMERFYLMGYLHELRHIIESKGLRCSFGPSKKYRSAPRKP